MYHPPALDDASREAIEKHVPAAKRIAIGEEDALAFACNAVNIDRTVVVNRATPAFVRALGRAGFEVIQTPLSEFMKAGGCAKCHSPTGDLAGLATRLQGLQLFQRMLYPGGRGRGCGRGRSDPCRRNDARRRRPQARGTSPRPAGRSRRRAG